VTFEAGTDAIPILNNIYLHDMVTSYQNHFSISYTNLRKQMWTLIKFIYPEHFQHLKPMYRRTTVQLWMIFRLH